MPEPWAVNASPLIILSRIGRLDLLESLTPTVLQSCFSYEGDPSSRLEEALQKRRLLKQRYL